MYAVSCLNYTQYCKNSVNKQGDQYGQYGYYTVSWTVFCLKEIKRTNGKMCVVHTCDRLECGWIEHDWKLYSYVQVILSRPLTIFGSINILCLLPHVVLTGFQLSLNFNLSFSVAVTFYHYNYMQCPQSTCLLMHHSISNGKHIKQYKFWCFADFHADSHQCYVAIGKKSAAEKTREMPVG